MSGNYEPQSKVQYIGERNLKYNRFKIKIFLGNKPWKEQHSCSVKYYNLIRCAFRFNKFYLDKLIIIQVLGHLVLEYNPFKLIKLTVD